MKIKAAVLNAMGAALPYAQSRPLSIDEVELDPPGHGEVLVKVAAAGLCHSDLSVINGDRPRPVPMALGHEASGVVEELGPGVDDLARGDHVVMVFVPSCGHCLPCAEGRPALCEPGAAANGKGTLLSGARRIKRKGLALNHHLGVSAFAEYVTVSRRSLVRIDRELALDEAALFGCAVLTGVGAVVNTARVPAGATVAVIGLGGVGLAALLGAIAAGASRVVAIDLADDKLEFAKQLGATDAFNARKEDCAEAVRAATAGGIEYAFELAGSVKAMELAYKITRRGGTTVTAGLPPPTANFSFPQVGLVAEERTIKGSYIGTCVPLRDLPRYVGLYRQGRLPVNKLLTHRIELSAINEGFDRLHEGKAIRQVVTFKVVTPQTNPFAAWLEFMARLQEPAEPAAGAAPELPFATPMAGFLETYRTSLEAFVGSLQSGGNVRWTDPAAVLDWMKTLAAPASVGGTDPIAKHPLLAGLRHVYAGAADAVGWGAYTKLAEALAEVGRAQAAASESQAKVWQAIGEIWTNSQNRFGETLRGMVERKESFADVQGFLRGWTAALDEAAHESMQSDAGLALTAEANRAATSLRIAQNRAVEVFSELYNIPTRAELDEAYRLIHELRKELRALKRAAPGS